MIGLAIGCILGQFVNFGFAVLFAYLGWSPLWLFPIAFVANIFTGNSDHRQVLLERGQMAGHLGTTMVNLYLVPALIWFSVQVGIYYFARWIMG